MSAPAGIDPNGGGGPLKNVAILGASGAVGAVMTRLLAERRFPVGSIKFLATGRSAGRSVEFAGRSHPIEAVGPGSFDGVDLVLSSTPASASLRYSPMASEAGAVVVDNSSAWRMDPAVPLVVPEVNPGAIRAHRGIIANPNCSTIQMVVALKPLHDAATIRRIVVSTYQSASGAGQKGIDELDAQLLARARNEPEPPPSNFAHPLAGNVVPQIDAFLPSGYTKEEMKMVDETRKILGDPSIEVCPTCVRVPVAIGHSESIRVELERPLTPADARALWADAPGLRVVDDPSRSLYPMPRPDSGGDDVLVGRIRQDLADPRALLFWCVGDNLRKGAALNAVQIAEHLL